MNNQNTDNSQSMNKLDGNQQYKSTKTLDKNFRLNQASSTNLL